ncbi:hypothetical protein J6590_038961 [Homalodisca vitripennis]|nr:hypothetical protein J6590_038961 [Homalodisca vitripennis]
MSLSLSHAPIPRILILLELQKHNITQPLNPNQSGVHLVVGGMRGSAEYLYGSRSRRFSRVQLDCHLDSTISGREREYLETVFKILKTSRQPMKPLHNEERSDSHNPVSFPPGAISGSAHSAIPGTVSTD